MANLYLFDTQKQKISTLKNEFKVRDVFSEPGALSWNNKGKLAVIGLNAVSIIDTSKKNNEINIKFDRATSVEFSIEGIELAIGGEKAKLYKLE